MTSSRYCLLAVFFESIVGCSSLLRRRIRPQQLGKAHKSALKCLKYPIYVHLCPFPVPEMASEQRGKGLAGANDCAAPWAELLGAVISLSRARDALSFRGPQKHAQRPRDGGMCVTCKCWHIIDIIYYIHNIFTYIYISFRMV